VSEPPDAAGAPDTGLVEQQIAYYRARAPEYDQWFFRQGQYDRGDEWNRAWFSAIEQVRKELSYFRPTGDVLELACGTGLWTEQLVQHADLITAVDASPEGLKLNEERLRDDRVRYLQADLFEWRPDTTYDVVFFGFWLSHVLPRQFEVFWETVRSALKPGGRVLFVNSLHPERSAEQHRHRNTPDDYVTVRKLNDGREFRLVKVFYDPEEISSRLRELGWNIRVRTSGDHALYAYGTVA